VFVVGVDGCRAGWISVALQDGQFAGAATFATFRELVDTVGEADAIGVDIPIGLLPDSFRVCDAVTKAFIGPRRASVFLTPPRSVVETPHYDDANEHCRALTGKGLSRQAYNLRAKILEVDEVVRDEELRARSDSRAPSTKKRVRHQKRISQLPESRESLRRFARIIEPEKEMQHSNDDLPGGRIVEVHPEASFRELAGQPLEHAKKSAEGIRDRLTLLERQGIHVPTDLTAIGGVEVDDVFDAAVVAWSANRYANRNARTLPPPELWERDGDRIVAIWI
jgi:predicted RNase H-like nuclease